MSPAQVPVPISVPQDTPGHRPNGTNGVSVS
ncbi:MAG: hypothetical protein QOE58_1230, partial [Actinomycetota bacterium]|nr:hypothetical protein [Actinomycetota bacterium]